MLEKRRFSMLLLICLLIVSCSKSSINKSEVINCEVSDPSTAPAVQFFEAYSGSEEESHGHYILACSDGGFLQIGETGFIPHSAKILVVKTNHNGVLVWRREFASNVGRLF